VCVFIGPQFFARSVTNFPVRRVESGLAPLRRGPHAATNSSMQSTTTGSVCSRPLLWRLCELQKAPQRR